MIGDFFVIFAMILTSIYAISDDNIDRHIVTNYRGNAQHDGYLEFGDSTFEFPLKSSWNITNNACYSPHGQGSVFVNNTFYCIQPDHLNMTEGYYDQSIFAVDAITGDTVWTITIFKLSYQLFDLTYLNTSNYQYLSLYQTDGSIIYIIDPYNGDIVHQISSPWARFTCSLCSL